MIESIYEFKKSGRTRGWSLLNPVGWWGPQEDEGLAHSFSSFQEAWLRGHLGVPLRLVEEIVKPWDDPIFCGKNGRIFQGEAVKMEV